MTKHPILTAGAASACCLGLLLAGAGAAAASGGGGGGGSSSGGGGTTTSSGAWPTAYPLPTNPGTVISQSSTRATVRSTDTVAQVVSKLDSTYAAMGCTRTVAVNKPRDYFCPAGGKQAEIYFTFADLGTSSPDGMRSQTNGFYTKP